ncbi:MAG: hypothetical protein P1U87_18725 [Verrucomicrobiales bacterium]|nr:hypothetical protein [Verrucomicrobiales bacterium]
MKPLAALILVPALFLIAGAGDLVGQEKGESSGLNVGFSQIDITPPVGAIMTGPRLPLTRGTDDPLMIRTMVVQSGDRILAIVGMDLVKIRIDLTDEAIAEATKRTGMERAGVLVCASHNHSSPFIPMGGPNNEKYIATLPGLIADSIEQAHAALQPARMSIGRSLIYGGMQNRRVITKSDGMALNTWLGKLNDLEETPQVLGTEGPIDPEMWVARFESPDGRVLGTLVNFTCHPALHNWRGHQDNGESHWSADFPGVIAEHIANQYGEQAVCVFTQGASGNINPAELFVPDWRERAGVFGKAAVHAAETAISVEGRVEVAYARRDVEVPLIDPMKQREGAITRLGWRPESFEAAKNSAAGKPNTREIPVSAARIGPLGIATNAGELFVEWGIDIKKRSPAPHTFVSELTNDWIGYEPTAEAFENEGYETLAGVAFVTLEGIETLVDTSVELLEGLWAEEAE